MIHKTCDGVRRRDFLRAGALGMTGLSLSSYMQLASAGEVKKTAPAKAGIFIFLQGGPSHLDTFDLKPDAPAEIRGLFNPIKTNVPGIEISEHLPNLAKCADKYAILRGVSHSLGAHELGTMYLNSGNAPLASLEYPGYGCVMSKEHPSAPDLPSFVAIPQTRQKPGFLGVRYAPLMTGGSPKADKPFTVRGISLEGTVTVADVERRTNLLRKLDTTFSSIDKNNELVSGLDEFGEQAHSIVTSTRARDAFDISKESPEFTKLFGTDDFSLSCLMAVRLVEAGVRFVTISLGGWDTHNDNFGRLQTALLPKLDSGVAGMLNGLDKRGLLDSTAVYVTGEFGRTPKINDRSNPGGRDHYPRCMFMLMAGGGIRGGQVVGKSDATAAAPANDVISPDDAAATFYHNLGIDHTKEYMTATGRPITIVRKGNIIKDLFTG